jgi:hypothetical protein
VIKEVLGYLSGVSFILLIVYFFYSFALKEVLRTTESAINNSSNKSISIIVFVMYVFCFTFTYLFFWTPSYFGFVICSIIGLIFPMIIFFVMKWKVDEKLSKIMLKETRYKVDPAINSMCMYFSVFFVIFFSVINAIVFKVILKNKGIILSNPLLILDTFILFFSVCVLFLASGYIFAFGTLHKLTRFNFIFTNGKVLNDTYLIGVNSDYYILKENNKKAISVKKDLIEKMEFQ